MRLLPARPNLGSALGETVDSVIASHSLGMNGGGMNGGMGGGRGKGGVGVAVEEYPCGVIVGCCGPVELGDQANGAVGGLDWRRWREVGGVEVYEEVFGW